MGECWRGWGERALAAWAVSALVGCGYLADLEDARYEPVQEAPSSGDDLGAGPGDVSQEVELTDDFLGAGPDEVEPDACARYESPSSALEALCGEMGCDDPADPFCGERCEGDCVCGEGEHCAGACASGEMCEPLCAEGSVCAFEGHSLGSMRLSCAEDATCRTQCDHLGLCETLCEEGATCEVECAHASQCRLTCERGSKCWMRCAQTGDCELDCQPGASCWLELEGAAGELACDSRVRECGDGQRVCRGECAQ